MGVGDGSGMILIGGCNLDPSRGQFMVGFELPGGTVVKSHLPMQEAQEKWVRSLGWEDPLAKEMAIHSSTLAWKIPWTEEPGRLQSMGSQRVGHD